MVGALRMASLCSRRFRARVTLPPPAMRTWLNYRPVREYASPPYLAHNIRDGVEAYWGILVPSGKLDRENLTSWLNDNRLILKPTIASPKRVETSMYKKKWITPYVRFVSKALLSNFLEELDPKHPHHRATIFRIRESMVPFIRDMVKALGRMPFARQMRRWTTVPSERETFDDSYIDRIDWSKPAIVHGLWKTDAIEVSPHDHGYRIHLWWHMPCLPDQTEIYKMNDPRGFEVIEISYSPAKLMKDGEVVRAGPDPSPWDEYAYVNLVHEVWIARTSLEPPSSFETNMGKMIRYNHSAWALQYAMGQMVKRFAKREKKKGWC
ncbi:hypothetical protein B0H67DRAFT_580190 [Lasiosphaeris hirsuta]|uniref:Uncharacterized protein n=1 Tax=Lasiosphaeris hirsuta TaxID=260670 RepID=A0AA40DT57_9PEZI|nr:hypothetical protein B0H67DRAFT_580190 [Lasiosphaeris hirsuta]